MTSRKGQLLALAVAFLAILLLAALANYRELTPEPQIVLRRDWAQPATLATLGRIWIAFASERGFYCPLFIGSTSRKLLVLNETYRLNIPFVWNRTHLGGYRRPESGWVTYWVAFYRGERVYVNVTVHYDYTLRGTYVRRVRGEETWYYNYTLRHYHEYVGPWGILRVCPALTPQGEADIRRAGDCLWVVGFPVDQGSLVLLDEFNVHIEVGGNWTLRP